jgi:hypothetical protein
MEDLINNTEFINNKETNKKQGTNSNNDSSNISKINTSNTNMKKGYRNEERKGNECQSNYYRALDDQQEESEEDE